MIECKIFDGKLKINNETIFLDPNYQFVSFLDNGTNAIVFRGKDILLNRPVAIKVWITHSDRPGPTKEKFLGEIRKISQLISSRIAQIYFAEIVGTTFYCAVYEFVDGISLEKWLQNDRTFEKRQTISDQIFHEILECHKKGICHGDLHLKNILITENDEIKIIDFGTSIFCTDIDPQKRERDLLLKTGNEIFPEVMEYHLLDEISLLTGPTPCIPLMFIQLPRVIQVIQWLRPREEIRLKYFNSRDPDFFELADLLVTAPFFDLDSVIKLLKNKIPEISIIDFLDVFAATMIVKDEQKITDKKLKSHLNMSEESISLFKAAYSEIRTNFIEKIKKDYPIIISRSR
jgi:serine/threonine protein kinase